MERPCLSLCFLILTYRVERSMPRMSADRAILPFAEWRVALISKFCASSNVIPTRTVRSLQPDGTACRQRLRWYVFLSAFAVSVYDHNRKTSQGRDVAFPCCLVKRLTLGFESGITHEGVTRRIQRVLCCMKVGPEYLYLIRHGNLD